MLGKDECLPVTPDHRLTLKVFSMRSRVGLGTSTKSGGASVGSTPTISTSTILSRRNRPCRLVRRCYRALQAGAKRKHWAAIEDSFFILFFLLGKPILNSPRCLGVSRSPSPACRGVQGSHSAVYSLWKTHVFLPMKVQKFSVLFLHLYFYILQHIQMVFTPKHKMRFRVSMFLEMPRHIRMEKMPKKIPVLKIALFF